MPVNTPGHLGRRVTKSLIQRGWRSCGHDSLLRKESNNQSYNSIPLSIASEKTPKQAEFILFSAHGSRGSARDVQIVSYHTACSVDLWPYKKRLRVIPPEDRGAKTLLRPVASGARVRLEPTGTGHPRDRKPIRLGQASTMDLSPRALRDAAPRCLPGGTMPS